MTDVRARYDASVDAVANENWSSNNKKLEAA
jgi:hypothetical protein